MTTTPDVATAPAAKEPIKAAPTAKPKGAAPATAKPSVSKVGSVKTAATKEPVAERKEAPVKEVKAKKPKLVRDSFTIPKDEYAVIDSLKDRAIGLSHPVKKSELLRAGLKLLAGLSDAALRTALQSVPSIKTGRPTKDAVAPQASSTLPKAAAKTKASAKARAK